jgi:hypothetical protein
MSFIDILIGFGYLVIVMFCLVTAFRPNAAVSSEHRNIFISITIILLTMLTLRLLNINVYLTETIRMLAKSQGWYEDRHIIQVIFVSGVFIFAIIFFMLMEQKFNAIWRSYSMAFYGIIFLISFIIIKNTSYHPIDQFLNRELRGVKLAGVIEFLNVMWVTGSLFFTYRRSFNKQEVPIVIQSSRYI